MSLGECYIGKWTKEQCHLDSYTAKKKSLTKIAELPEDDSLRLYYRISNYEVVPNADICDHHACKYLHHHTSRLYKCYEPFKLHDKIIRNDLRHINFETCKKYERYFKAELIAGQ